jgi:hypothetical protein
MQNRKSYTSEKVERPKCENGSRTHIRELRDTRVLERARLLLLRMRHHLRTPLMAE